MEVSALSFNIDLKMVRKGRRFEEITRLTSSDADSDDSDSEG